MPLKLGTTIGVYEVTVKIGAAPLGDREVIEASRVGAWRCRSDRDGSVVYSPPDSRR